jgi:hypothetical protein
MPKRDAAGRFLKVKRGRPAKRMMLIQTCPCGRKCLRNRVICEVCSKDSAQKARMQYQLQIRRWQDKIDREAEAETKGLKAGEPTPPVVAESIINRWIRGD